MMETKWRNNIVELDYFYLWLSYLLVSFALVKTLLLVALESLARHLQCIVPVCLPSTVCTDLFLFSFNCILWSGTVVANKHGGKRSLNVWLFGRKLARRNADGIFWKVLGTEQLIGCFFAHKTASLRKWEWAADVKETSALPKGCSRLVTQTGRRHHTRAECFLVADIQKTRLPPLTCVTLPSPSDSWSGVHEEVCRETGWMFLHLWWC